MRDVTFSIPLSVSWLSLTAQDNRFRLSGIPSYSTLPAHIKALHRHSEFEIFFVPDSSLTVHTAEKNHCFSDALVILPPSLSHHVSYEKGTEGYYLYFSAEPPRGKESERFEALTKSISHRIVTLPLSEDERFYLKKLNGAWDLPQRSEQIPHLFALLFGEIFERLVPTDSGERTATTVKYGKYINAVDTFLSMHYTKPIRLSDLAQELYLCPKQASRIVKKAYGCSFPDLINRHRLGVACMLLLYTELEIKEIASQVGYESDNYFYTLFRQAYKMTPKQYREQNKTATQDTKSVQN